ncbi:DUF3618 domain-containing protein [Sphingomonas sp. 28-63-12]|uniref:DUF3618 domain-containing protein n=1 Tax=Sphingomonas sp. 28-63-12 TaxID=1970434 RepID=UPI000BDAE466|nr:MAG: hypothetical protein B7Y47_03570 [Sphingomonas sp. 28-63-12]
MVSVENERDQAEIDAALARAQLTATLVDLQARLNPRALARDAIDELRDTGITIARGALAAAQRNPGPLIGIGATLVAIFARDWITDAFAEHGKVATAAPSPRSTEIDDHDGAPRPRERTSND